MEEEHEAQESSAPQVVSTNGHAPAAQLDDAVIEQPGQDSSAAATAAADDPVTAAQPGNAPAEQAVVASSSVAGDDFNFDDWDLDDEEDEEPGLLADMVSGAIGGLIGTLPMSGVMLLWQRKLPFWQRYALPPQQVMTAALEKLGLRQHTDREQRKLLTTLAHFGYGAAVGAIYKPLARRLPGPGPLKGALFGLLLWIVGYLGWLPALGIHPGGDKQPDDRRALMIAAHLVYGAVTDLVAARIEGQRD